MSKLHLGHSAQTARCSHLQRYLVAINVINHHQRIKRCRVVEGFQANEELQILILLDLLNQIFIGETQTGLDN